MSQTISYLLLEASLQTLYMVAVASIISTAVGLPVGVLLYITRKGNIFAKPWLYQTLATIVNVTRSIPFIILLMAVTPLTHLLVGTSIGTNASIVPLSIGAMPFIARIVESALLEVNRGLIEAATAMGATPWQIIRKVLLPEAFPSIINGLTLTIITLIGYSAMAGAVGGGGLGDVAIRYGYHRFDMGLLVVTIAVLIILVQVIQLAGDCLAKKLSHFKA
jgi:D-methionine transport system permease protein